MTKTNFITKLTGTLLAFALAMSFMAPAAAALESAEPEPNQPIVEEAVETVPPEPSDPTPNETVIEPASQPETETSTDNVASETPSEGSDSDTVQGNNGVSEDNAVLTFESEQELNEFIAALPEDSAVMVLSSAPAPQAALSADENGTAYGYDLNGYLYTGYTPEVGSREQFTQPHNWSPYIQCPVCGTEGHRIAAGTCTLPHQYVICIDPSVAATGGNVSTYAKIIHRHRSGGDTDTVAYIPWASNLYYGMQYYSDTVAPTAPEVIPSTGDWTNQDVTVDISGSVDSGLALERDADLPTNNGKGVNHYEYSVDGTGYLGLAEGYGSPEVVITEEGVHTVYARAVDDAKNISGTAESNVKIDKTNPVLDVIQTILTWTRGNISMLIGASDALSGLAGVSVNGSDIGAADSYDVTDNGEYEFSATDLAGNVNTQRFSITNIDRIAPSVDTAPDKTEWTNQPVNISVSAKDNESGLSQVTLPDGTSSDSFAVTANGTYTVMATDAAGNVTTKTISVSNIDTVPPNLSVTPTVTDSTYDAVPISVAVSDGESGIALVMLPDGSTVDASDFTFTANANGDYTFKAIDNAGNEVELTVTVDNIVPRPAAPEPPVTPAEPTEPSKPSLRETPEEETTAAEEPQRKAVKKRAEASAVQEEEPTTAAISLFDLFCALLAAALTVYCLLRKSLKITLVTAVMSLVLITLFIVTQPAILRFVLFDEWSLVFGALALSDAVVTLILCKRDDPDEEYGNTTL